MKKKNVDVLSTSIYRILPIVLMAQSAGSGEYSDCISQEG